MNERSQRICHINCARRGPTKFMDRVLGGVGSRPTDATHSVSFSLGFMSSTVFKGKEVRYIKTSPWFNRFMVGSFRVKQFRPIP